MIRQLQGDVICLIGCGTVPPLIQGPGDLKIMAQPASVARFQVLTCNYRLHWRSLVRQREVRFECLRLYTSSDRTVAMMTLLSILSRLEWQKIRKIITGLLNCEMKGFGTLRTLRTPNS